MEFPSFLYLILKQCKDPREALCTAPVWALLTKIPKAIFVTDASEIGIGAVLMQEQQPISYYSKALGVSEI